MENLSSQLLSFIKKSPSCFHAVKNISEELLSAGFSELKESEKWNLKSGCKYFVTRNSSSVIAFAVPEADSENADDASSILGFNIIASHSDSPSFKIKENPEIKSAGCTVLNVEKYGGMLINPWFDRPLSVAGRVITNKNGTLHQILVNLDRDLVMIPNLAIHMKRDANDGHKIDVQNEIRPVLSLNENALLMKLVAESAGVSEKDIISSDLFLYNRCEASVWGAENEFISSPKLDDLECAYTTLKGFLNATASAGESSDNASELVPERSRRAANASESSVTASTSSDKTNAASIPVYCVFDNEEVGSQSRQGAASTFLKDTLYRISLCLCQKNCLNGSGTQNQNLNIEENYRIRLAKSFMVSADNAHAVHPNYVSSADPVNQPKINGGIVIKFNAAQKYTSDGISAAFFKEVCRKAGVTFQIFTNNSNIAGGSTLGNISQTQVSVPCVDIGLAQWAMHSPYETAGAKDADFMAKASEEFYKSVFDVKF